MPSRRLALLLTLLVGASGLAILDDRAMVAVVVSDACVLALFAGDLLVARGTRLHI